MRVDVGGAEFVDNDSETQSAPDAVFNHSAHERGFAGTQKTANGKQRNHSRSLADSRKVATDVQFLIYCGGLVKLKFVCSNWRKIMSRRCELTGKKPMSGNMVSHSMRHTK